MNSNCFCWSLAELHTSELQGKLRYSASSCYRLLQTTLVVRVEQSVEYVCLCAQTITFDLTQIFAMLVQLAYTPFPQINIIGAMVIVQRVRGKLSGLFCAILCATIVHSAMHTHMNRPNSSVDWVLSHWAHFTVLRFIFVLCIIACMCRSVTW